MIILFKVFKGLQIGLRAQFQWKCIYLIKHYNQQLITHKISVNEATRFAVLHLPAYCQKGPWYSDLKYALKFIK